MKAYFLFTADGPVVILTSCNYVEHPKLLAKLQAKGFDKFVAHELSLEDTKERYGGHFDVVCNDLYESDDLRVLDYNGQRAFKNFRFNELGPPIYYEPE